MLARRYTAWGSGGLAATPPGDGHLTHWRRCCESFSRQARRPPIRVTSRLTLSASALTLPSASVRSAPTGALGEAFRALLGFERTKEGFIEKASGSHLLRGARRRSP